MTEQQEKILKEDLARNIVKFETWKNEKDQSVCIVSIGGIEAVKRYAQDGQEKEVLGYMMTKFWGIWKGIGLN